MSKDNFGISIAYIDSLRGRAYLDAFKKSGVSPAEVIWLGSEMEQGKDFSDEANKYGYAEKYFDLNISPEQYFSELGIPINRIISKDINSAEFLNALESISSPYCIFTGGGIIKEHILNSGVKLIHMHPGRIPEFRGSTCFYYSLLEESLVEATAFFMAPQLDTGDIIAFRAFQVNLNLNGDQSSFMDNILDPYIRSVVLQTVLEKFKSGAIDGIKQTKGTKPAYFIMHPLLRYHAKQKVKNQYSPSASEGIIAIS